MPYDEDPEKRKAYEAGRAGSPHAASPATLEAYERGLREHREAHVAGAQGVVDLFLARTRGMGCLQAVFVTATSAVLGFLEHPLGTLAALSAGLATGVVVKSFWDSPWG